MYNYKYTLEVSSLSDNAEKYLIDTIDGHNIEYYIEKDLLNQNEVAINLKGLKSDLDRFEIKLIKNLSKLADVHDFTKTSTELFPDILKDNSYLDLNACDFSLFYKSKYLQNPLEESVKLLKSQKIGIVKNINGCYICSISSKTAPVKKIRELVSLPTQTLPILSKTKLQASRFVSLSKKEDKLLSSDIKPVLRVKKKNIHRLEKVTNIPINSIAPTNLYSIKLPKNSLEEYLASEVNIPLVFYKINNPKDFYEQVDFILQFKKSFIEYEDSFMQIIYGKTQILKAGFGLSPITVKLPKKVEENMYSICDSTVAIAFDDTVLLSASGMKTKDFFILNHFKSNKEIKNTVSNPVSLIHAYESKFKEAIIFEFSTTKAEVLKYHHEKLELLYKFKKPPKEYFDDSATKSKLIKEIHYTTETQLICDTAYEICFEKSFDFSIKDHVIDIDLSKDLERNEICSALLNSLTNIVKEITNEENLPIILCGDLFENKNLTENIIEFFDDHDKKYYISQTLPLNESVAPLGTILDFCLKK